MIRFVFISSILIVAVMFVRSTHISTNDQYNLNIHVKAESVLDPSLSKDCGSSILIRLLFEGLFRIDEHSNPVPALVESFHKTKDALTYTFNLKTVYWSDGHPLTSYDIAKSWKHVLTPSLPSFNAGVLFCILNAQQIKDGYMDEDMLGVKCPDNKTLVVTLQHPLQETVFFELLSFDTFLPSGRWHDNNRIDSFNGPFVISKVNKSCYSFVKNNMYHDKQHIHFQNITAHIIDHDESALAMFERGQLDFVGGPLFRLPSEAFDTFTGVYTYDKAMMIYWLIFNLTDSVFNDINNRKLIASVINKQSICTVLQGGRKVANSLFMESNNPQITKPNGRNISSEITLVINKELQNTKIAQILQEQLLNANINLRIKTISDWKTYNSLLMDNDFQIARYGWRPSTHDKMSILDPFYLPHYNFTKWGNPKFKHNISLAHKTVNEDYREKLLNECEKLILDDYVVVPIFFEPFTALKHEMLTGICVSRGGIVDFSRSTKLRKCPSDLLSN